VFRLKGFSNISKKVSLKLIITYSLPKGEIEILAFGRITGLAGTISISPKSNLLYLKELSTRSFYGNKADKRLHRCS
jgi:hypothetical protein